MARGPLLLIALLLLLVGGIVLLSRSADEVPVQTMEVDVSRDSAAN